MNIDRLFWLVMILGALAVPGFGADAINYWERPAKKLIEFSHSSPGVEYLRWHVAELERNAPYDGIGIRFAVAGKADGKDVTCSGWTILSDVPWKYEWVQQTAKQLRETPFRKFKYNFLRTTANPGTVAPFDHVGWKNVCNNFGIASRLAREGGLTGLAFDIEQYGHTLWAYDPKSGHSLEETERMMRQRGREFADAIFSAYPDQVFFCFFGLSVNRMIAERSDRKSQDAWAQTYRLFPAFFNGILDRLPPEASIVDGNEGRGYEAKTASDFAFIRRAHREILPRLLDRDNLAKYRSQVQIGVGLYLDPYFHPDSMKPGMRYFEALSPKRKDRVIFWSESLSMAFQHADEYVWTWGEGAAWWSSSARNKQWTLWETLAPGVTESMEQVRKQNR